MSIVAGVYASLIADSTVANAVASYKFDGVSGTPAIFTRDPAPDDAAGPLIVISEVSAIAAGRDRGTRGGEVTVDVKVWGERDTSYKVLRDLSLNIWKALDRATLTISGFECVNVVALMPTRLDDPDGFPGYVVTIRVLVREV